MSRPFPLLIASTCLLMTAFLWAGSIASTGSRTGRNKSNAVHRAKATASAQEAKPAQAHAPKTAAELQQELAGTFKSGRFSSDSIEVQVEQQGITLTGTVHGAEDKGVATSEARLIARKGGWNDVHVMNRLAVSLPASW